MYIAILKWFALPLILDLLQVTFFTDSTNGKSPWIKKKTFGEYLLELFSNHSLRSLSKSSYSALFGLVSPMTPSKFSLNHVFCLELHYVNSTWTEVGPCDSLKIPGTDVRDEQKSGCLVCIGDYTTEVHTQTCPQMVRGLYYSVMLGILKTIIKDPQSPTSI